MNDKLTLTRAEIAAIVDYVFQHTRGNPNGKGYRVWLKMMEFLNEIERLETPKGD